MGISGISVPQLLIVLAIVLLVFGTKRMTSLGADLGGAIKGFRTAMAADDEKAARLANEVVAPHGESAEAAAGAQRHGESAKDAVAVAELPGRAETMRG